MEAVAFFDDDADVQMRASWDGARAQVSADSGDWESAYRNAMVIDPEMGGIYPLIALTAAAWLDDADKVRSAAARLAESAEPFPETDTYAEAILTAMSGDTARASTLFTKVLDVWKIRVLNRHFAEAQVTFARMVGLDDPAAAQAAQDAYTWVTSTGSNAFLSVWAEGLPPQASSEAVAG